MKRTSKALARSGIAVLGTLAVLAAPIAIGTASADPTLPGAGSSPLVSTPEAPGVLPASNTPGPAFGGKTNVSSPQSTNNTNAAQFWVYHQTNTVQNLTLSISGSTTAYFPTTGQGAGVTTTGGQTASCTTAADGNGNTDCTFLVADTVAESVTVAIGDTTDNSSTSQVVDFNGLNWDPCSAVGINGNPPGNCVTQGTISTSTPETVHYLAGGQPGATRVLTFITTGSAVFSGSQPSNVQVTNVAATTARCTTDSSGNCTLNIIDATPETAAVFALIAGSDASPYPQAVAEIDITFGAGSVTPGELDLNKVQVIAPTTQATGFPNGFAEPGDVIQETYTLRGAPRTQGQSGCANTECPGTALANSNVTLNVSNGFFTPNCVIPASASPASLTNNNYANCTFNTAPANNAKVGDLKSSGQTTTVKTDSNGQFVVSLGIAKDAGFDDNGFVTAKVTAGSLAPRASGNTNTTSSSTCANNSNSPFDPVLGGGTTFPGGGVLSGCNFDVEWTTNEMPLNGGTAKYVVVPAIKNPSNTFNASENNFNATDTGTNNVPDVDRVVVVVHLTDQFGNLTSNLGASSTPAGATITKTGPGDVFRCTSFSTTDACSNGSLGTQISSSVQPDGTTTQVESAVGSYTNNVPGHFSGNTTGQFRYEFDANSPNSAQPVNFSPTSLEGVNDGTQTDKLSWTPETTVFTGVITGTASTPSFANYTAGVGTASTDTLVINFYNQLAQTVITFAVKPGHTVRTGTGVTVTATVKDQFGNGITNQLVQFVRTGSNDASCVPIQNGGTGVANPVVTNAAGIAGYTFSCNSPGTSTVSVVVTGPGGTQLATGREQVVFTGSTITTIHERPSLSVHKHGHKVHLVATTHPTLRHHVVHFYIVKHGIHHLVGSKGTGGDAKAAITIHLKKGHYTLDCRVVKAGKHVISRYSKNHHVHIT